MDETEGATPLGGVDAEIKELLGLFDVPAFARRGQDVEYARTRLHARCSRARGEMLDMVRLRLRQWAAASTGPADDARIFADAIGPLWPLAGAEAPRRAHRAESDRRLRAIARDLVASVERFNRRWSRAIDAVDLAAINRQIDHYNRYYVLEKECVLGSARLAARHFVPLDLMTLDDLRREHPLLPIPRLKA